jgi:hypothetical protein
VPDASCIQVDLRGTVRRLGLLLAGLWAQVRNCAASCLLERSTVASRLETRTEDSGWLASGNAPKQSREVKAILQLCPTLYLLPPGAGGDRD